MTLDYLRNTISENRQYGLAVMNIHRDVDIVITNEIIDTIGT